MEVLSCYPEYQQKFQTEIARDLTFNLGEGGELDADVSIAIFNFL